MKLRGTQNLTCRCDGTVHRLFQLGRVFKGDVMPDLTSARQKGLAVEDAAALEGGGNQVRSPWI